MAFVLPRANAAAPPAPKTDDVRIEQVVLGEGEGEGEG